MRASATWHKRRGTEVKVCRYLVVASCAQLPPKPEVSVMLREDDTDEDGRRFDLHMSPDEADEWARRFTEAARQAREMAGVKAPSRC